jgi:hypothetical protein
MAAKNAAENKRFVHYAPDKKRTEYLVPTHRPSSRIPTIQITEPLPATPRPIATPARRVVVIRNTKNAESNQGPVDLKNFEPADSERNPPVIDRGVSVGLIDQII